MRIVHYGHEVYEDYNQMILSNNSLSLYTLSANLSMYNRQCVLSSDAVIQIVSNREYANMRIKCS
jgi:hypothetical protein